MTLPSHLTPPGRHEHTIGCVSARIECDSITDGGARLVTWVLTYPRMIHAEFMTHRCFSRNSASSRAIPAKRMRELVREANVEPAVWGANQAGMQSSTEVADVEAARAWWNDARDRMLGYHELGEKYGLHKQIVNRVVEPWMPITVVASATDHANFFHLRKHAAAEPNFQRLAAIMWGLFHESMPDYVAPGGWHLPFTKPDEREHMFAEDLRKIATGRCARVSYLTHDGVRDIDADIKLHDQLAATARSDDPMHASPFEHVAQAMGRRERWGNFEGWMQYRKTFEKEAGPDTDDRCMACGCWGGRHVHACPVFQFKNE